MIADHDVNSYVLASSSAIKGLLTTSHRMVTMGLEDLYDQGQIMLSGEERKKLRLSKLQRAAADERLGQAYHRLATRLALLEAQLMTPQKEPRKTDRKSTHHVVWPLWIFEAARANIIVEPNANGYCCTAQRPQASRG